MHIYLSRKYQNQFETSFPFELVVNSASDLQSASCHSDYCMARFKDGYTQKGQFKKCHTSRDDFLESDCLYIDIDNDSEQKLTIQQFLEKYNEIEFYLTTSKSHNKLKNGIIADRFHVLFPLTTPIKDILKMKDSLNLLHSYIGVKIADKACLDVARKFYGNKDNETIYNKGEKKIDDIIQSKVKELKPFSPKKKIDYAISDVYKKEYFPSVIKASKLGWFKNYRDWIAIGIALHKANYPYESWFEICNDDMEEKEIVRKWKSFEDAEMTEKNAMQYIYSIHDKLKYKNIV